MFIFSRAGKFLLTGIFLLTLILPSHAADVVNNNSDGTGSLKWAVEQVNTGTTSSITISSDVKEIHLSQELTLTRSARITGNGAMIDGEETRRLFRITNGHVIFDGLTFTRGNAASGSGGAVEVDGSGASAEFSNCIFYGNKALDYGGAVCVTTGSELSPTVFRNCTITSNTSQSGGGIAASSGTMHVFSSIVTGNWGSDDIRASGGTVHTRYSIIGTMNISADKTDMAGQTVSQILVSKNGAASIDVAGGIHMIRITKSSPAYNFVNDPEYSSSYDIAGTFRPQYGAYDAGAYEIPAIPLTAASLQGVPYIMIGDRVKFSLDIFPENASINSEDFPPDGIEWQSSNQSVITASGDGVLALSSGSADVWTEVHGWDSHGRALTLPSNIVRVYAGGEAFTELRAEISPVTGRTLRPGAALTIRPEIHIVIDRYNLDDADGVGYSLDVESSRPEIVSADVISGDAVRLRAGYTEGVSVVTLFTGTIPEGRTETRPFTVSVVREHTDPVSPDVSRDASGVGRSSGGCDSGMMILAGIMAAVFVAKKGEE